MPERIGPRDREAAGNFNTLTDGHNKEPGARLWQKMYSVHHNSAETIVSAGKCGGDSSEVFAAMRCKCAAHIF